MDQPGKVVNPPRGQLNRKKYVSPFPPENLVSRDKSDRPVPRQPAHSYVLTQAESGTSTRFKEKNQTHYCCTWYDLIYCNIPGILVL